MEWQMADANEPFTEDWDHVEACYQWVTNIPGVRVNNKCARPRPPTPNTPAAGPWIVAAHALLSESGYMW